MAKSPSQTLVRQAVDEGLLSGMSVIGERSKANEVYVPREYTILKMRVRL